MKTRSELKQLFITGAKPTQQHFSDWLDSYRHSTDAQQVIRADAPPPSNGDFWYNSTIQQFQGTRNGVVQNLLMGNDAIQNQQAVIQQAGFKIGMPSTMDLGNSGYYPLSLRNNITGAGVGILFSTALAADRFLGYGENGTDGWSFNMAHGTAFIKPALLDLTLSASTETMGIDTSNYSFGSTASATSYAIGPNSFFVYDRLQSQYKLGIKPNGNVILGGHTDTGGKLQVNGGALRLAADGTDYAYLPGGLQYRSDLNKARLGAAGSWKNIATEDWVMGLGSVFGEYAGNLLVVDGNAATATDIRSGADLRHIGIPYKTIAAAAAVAGINDMIYVRGGNYTLTADLELNCRELHIHSAEVTSTHKIKINTTGGLDKVFIRCTGGTTVTVAAIEGVNPSGSLTMTGDSTGSVICTDPGYNINVPLNGSYTFEYLFVLKSNIYHTQPLVMTRIGLMDGYFGTTATTVVCEGTNIQYTGGALFPVDAQLAGATMLFMGCNIGLTHEIVAGQSHAFHLYIYNTSVYVNSITSGALQGAEVRIVSCPLVSCASFLFSINGKAKLNGRHQILNTPINVGTNYLWPALSGDSLVVQGIVTNAENFFDPANPASARPDNLHVNENACLTGVSTLF